MKLRNSKGFSLPELLVVLVIIGILAAVAMPIYLQQTKRAKASEAVATMGLIRQALRDYYVNKESYYKVAQGKISLPFPGTGTGDAGVDVDVKKAQYFSNGAFRVDYPADTSAFKSQFASPSATDFIIVAQGSTSSSPNSPDDNMDCASAKESESCSINPKDVANYQIVMDNSGRVRVSYDKGTTWSTY